MNVNKDIYYKIKERIGSLKGQYCICYTDLNTGYTCNIGNNDIFPASGMVKTLALVEYFNQLELGKINESDIYLLNRKDFLKNVSDVFEPDYGVLNYLREGIPLTIDEICKLMVVVSDNVAFNILVKLLGIENINKTLKSLGFNHFEINRLIFEREKMNQGINNYLSVSEMCELFFRIYKGQIVSSFASNKIVELMSLHQRSNIIPYYFMEKVPVAHQASFDSGLIYDMGIVLTDNPYILCMCVKTEDTRKAESIMRDITQICYINSQQLNGEG